MTRDNQDSVDTCQTCGKREGEATYRCDYCGQKVCCQACGLASMTYHRASDCPEQTVDPTEESSSTSYRSLGGL